MTVSDRDIEQAVSRARSSAALAVRRRGAFHLADEAEASAVASVARSLELFDESRGVPFPVYASRRALGGALDAIRDWRGRTRPKPEAAPPERPDFDWAEPAPVGVNPDADPLELLIVHDELERVLAIIDSLPDVLRDTILMVCVDGLPMAEVGRRMGVTESAICLRMKRFRKRLPALLAE